MQHYHGAGMAGLLRPLRTALGLERLCKSNNHSSERIAALYSAADMETTPAAPIMHHWQVYKSGTTIFARHTN